MDFIANIVVAVIGALHVCILVLEMFLWDKPATGLALVFLSRVQA